MGLICRILAVRFKKGRRVSVRKLGLKLISLLVLLPGSLLLAQEVSQYQYWLELEAADQTFVRRSAEIGRTRAFLEFLGEGSIIFRNGPIDAQELYSSEEFPVTANELSWKSHYIDVSRAGDLGLSAGPLAVFDRDGNSVRDTFGHLISIWRKNGSSWELMADLAVPIPGFLSLDVEPNFDDTLPVLEETAHPVMAMAESNTLQSLIEADNLFGRAINFRGGQRALLRYGLENTRVYLPDMAPAVGAESASLVYGAYLDDKLSTTNPISLSYVGGFLSESKEMGYTYGTMATNSSAGEAGFRTNYLRLWRFTASNEWKIAVEVLRPF
jgi:hypothetical protein